MTDLLDRLRKVDGSDEGTHWYRNPDGPEAAREIERLQADLDTKSRDLAARTEELEQAKALLSEAHVMQWKHDSVYAEWRNRIDAWLARRGET